MNLSSDCRITGLEWQQWQDPISFGAELTHLRLRGIFRRDGKAVVIQTEQAFTPLQVRAVGVNIVALTREHMKAEWLTELGKHLFADD